MAGEYMDGYNQLHKSKEIKPKFIMLSILFGASIGIISRISIGSIIICSIIVIAGWILYMYSQKEDRKFLINLFIAGISIRVILLVITYAISMLKGEFGELAGGQFVPDSRMYSLRAIEIFKSWHGDYSWVGMTEGCLSANGYLYLIAFFYDLVRYNPTAYHIIAMVPDRMINCLIGTLSAVFIFYTAKEIFNQKIAKLTAILVMFFPSLILWSITNVRDPSHILLVSIMFWGITKFQKRGNLKFTVLVFLSLAGLYTIRGHIANPVLIIVYVTFLILLWRQKRRKVIIIILAASFLLYFFPPIGHKIKSKFIGIKSVSTNPIRTHESIRTQVQGGAMYNIYDEDILQEGRINRVKLMKGFLKGWTYFMLVPFPWELYSLRQTIAMPQIIVWYLLIPFIIIGIGIAVRFKIWQNFAILAYLFVVTFAFAAVEGNVGSAFRHRDLVLPFYIIYGAVGIAKMLGWKIFPEEKKNNIKKILYVDDET